MKNKIPTAEDLLQNIGMDMYDEKYHNIKSLLIEFAKLHVEQALKAAAENAKAYTTISTYEGRKNKVRKESILNSYPLDNIK